LRKYIIILLFISVTPSPAKTQILLSLLFGDKLNSDKMSFGAHVDYSWNKLSGYEKTAPLKDLNLGLFFTYHCNDHWHINAEMLLKYKRGIDKLQPYNLENDSLNNFFRDGSVKRAINYLSIPLAVQYLFKPGFYIEMGPQISLRLNAYDIFSANPVQGELELKKNIKDNINPWDFGWVAGAGYRIGKEKLIAIGFRYNGGFTDVVKNEPGIQLNRQWGFYANIPIGKKATRTNGQGTSDHAPGK
jgi:hypothetical protein